MLGRHYDAGVDVKGGFNVARDETPVEAPSLRKLVEMQNELIGLAAEIADRMETLGERVFGPTGVDEGGATREGVSTGALPTAIYQAEALRERLEEISMRLGRLEDM